MSRTARVISRLLILSPLTLGVASLSACGPRTQTNEFIVAPGGYDTAFNAARDVLRDHRFKLARVDADQGVISTSEKPSAGLATPWDLDQSGVVQEFDDFLNQQRRGVRVTFDPPGPDGSRTGRVWVTTYRMQTPGLRVPARAPTLATTTQDPARTAQGVGGRYEIPVVRDEALEKRLAAQILEQAAKPPPQ